MKYQTGHVKRKTILFKIELLKIKCLGINPIKEVKDFYTENYKTLTKETEDDSNGKISHALGLEELILLKGHPTQSHIQI